jgi:hypothetical protein
MLHYVLAVACIAPHNALGGVTEKSCENHEKSATTGKIVVHKPTIAIPTSLLSLLPRSHSLALTNYPLSSRSRAHAVAAVSLYWLMCQFACSSGTSVVGRWPW